MEANSATAAAGIYREERTPKKRQPDYAQRNALDESQRSAMETAARALWPMAKRLCTIRQMAGIWEKIFSELTKDADTENLSIDSTCIKVHESSNGGKKNRR